MKKLKTTLCILTACAMLSPLTAFADSVSYKSDELIKAELFADRAGKVELFDDDEVAPPTDEEKEFIAMLADGIYNREDEINIPEEYTIPADRFEDLFVYFVGSYIQFERPEIIDIPMVGIRGTTARVAVVECEYNKTDEEYNAAQMAIYTELDNIKTRFLSDDMSELEKVLAVHDYIAEKYEYDLRLYDRNENMLVNRDLDGMIMEKTGVCEGYMKLFKFVMDNIGIECVSVPSDECAHIWNKVKIGDEEKKWYNVDVTADDATMNMSSNILHSFFLVSDETLLNAQDDTHSAWNETKWDGVTPAEVADSNDFDNWVFRKVSGPLVYQSGEWYGISQETNYITNYDVNLNQAETVYEGTGEYKWFDKGSTSQTWSTKSTMVKLNGNIYFNSPNKIYQFLPSLEGDERIREIYDFEEKNPNKKDVSKTYIYGIRSSDNVLYAEHTTNPNGYILDAKLPVLETSYRRSYIYGYDEEGRTEITFRLQYELQKQSRIFIAQYDENNNFIGIADGEQHENKISFAPAENCTTVKTFIWNKETNEPYTPGFTHTI